MSAFLTSALHRLDIILKQFLRGFHTFQKVVKSKSALCKFDSSSSTKPHPLPALNCLPTGTHLRTQLHCCWCDSETEFDYTSCSTLTCVGTKRLLVRLGRCSVTWGPNAEVPQGSPSLRFLHFPICLLKQK